jgi:hypothetical protein
VVGGVGSWNRIGDARSHLDRHDAERAAAVREELPLATFDRWRARLAEGDRWWLDVPDGARVGLTNRGAVYRTYAVYWFLPSLPAASEREATDVFRLDRVP